MFDTRERHRTIKRMNELIIRMNNGFEVLNSPKALLQLMGFDKKSVEAKYVKRNGLKLNKAEDVVVFLEYLENRK